MNKHRFIRCIAILLATVSISCHAVEEVTILVVGDSLSSEHGLESGQGWVLLMEREMTHRGRHVDVVNDSISGDTTAGGVARLPAALQRVQPDWVIIELGGNDGLRGNSLKAMEENLFEMVRLSHANGTKPILLGMRLPPNYGHKYTTGFEQTYQRVADATNTPLLPFFIGGIETDLKFFQADRIHPTAEAQPIIAQNVREFLSALW